MPRTPPKARATPRTTALGAVAIFVPLFTALLWWAFAHRVAPVAASGRPAFGTLSPAAAVFAAVFAAAGVAVIAALARANRRRLRAVLRPNRGRVIASIVLAFLIPVMVVEWRPLVLGLSVVNLLSYPTWRGAIGVPAVLTLATAIWYPITGLIISGVRERRLRFFVFALAWWSCYAGALLIWGFATIAVYPLPPASGPP